MDDEDIQYPTAVRRAKSGFERAALPIFLAALFAGAVWLMLRSATMHTSNIPPAGSGDYAMFVGVVIDNHTAVAPIDGDAYLTVSSDDGSIRFVTYKFGWNGCAGTGVSSTGSGIVSSDRIEVLGVFDGGSDINACYSPANYIKKLGTGDVYGNWKTYTDAAGGYSFRYPATWILSTSTVPGQSGAAATLTPFGAAKPAVTFAVFSGNGIPLGDWIRYYFGSQSGETIVAIDNGAALGNARASAVMLSTPKGERLVYVVKNGDSIVHIEPLLFVSPEAFRPDPDALRLSLLSQGIVFLDAEPPVSSGAQSNSGVAGIVTIGPTCPVAREGDASCADRPYAANLRVTDIWGNVVLRFAVGSDGTFQVELPAGDYKIENDSAAMLPSLNPVPFTVPTGQFIFKAVRFDSGIR